MIEIAILCLTAAVALRWRWNVTIPALSILLLSYVFGGNEGYVFVYAFAIAGFIGYWFLDRWTPKLLAAAMTLVVVVGTISVGSGAILLGTLPLSPVIWGIFYVMVRGVLRYRQNFHDFIANYGPGVQRRQTDGQSG